VESAARRAHRPSAAGNYVADAFFGAGAGGRVAHDQPRLQHSRNRVGARGVEPFDDRRDRTFGLLAGLLGDRGQVDVAELRKQAVV
jgi:hypothetical protein